MIALQSSGASELLIAPVNQFRSDMMIFLWYLPGVQPSHYTVQQHIVEKKRRNLEVKTHGGVANRPSKIAQVQSVR